MTKYNVFHIEFDVDDEFGDDWSILKSDFQDQLEEKYVGIWEADSQIDALDDITSKSGYDIKNACLEEVSA